MQKEMNRNYGIDALRIFSMFLVLIMHILGQGKIIAAVEPASPHYYMSWLLETIAYCSVNCFGLISGYVGIDAKFKYTNLLILWLQVAFYTVGITCLFAVFEPETITMEVIFNAFFPVMSKQYWYVSSYIGLGLLIPILNKAIHEIKKQKLQIVLLSVFVFYSVNQTLIRPEVFGTGGGYSTIWLAILYMFGAYLKKYGWDKFTVRKGLLIYGICVVLTWLGKVNGLMNFGLLSYISPTIVIISITLILLFSRIHFSEQAKKAIGTTSPLAFSAYLIHVHPLIWEHWMYARFDHYVLFSVPGMMLAVLRTAAVILIICMLVDKVRLALFNSLRIKERIYKVEANVLGVLMDE